jgi:endo-1,4-beta-xylanase
MATMTRPLVLLLALVAPVAAAADLDCRAPGSDCALREAAAQVGVLMGTAVRPPALENDPNYGPALARDFNSITDEWTMKWQAIHPAPGVYEFESGDALVNFAEANDMAVRGHTLIWDQDLIDSTPEYVTAISDPQELRDLMTEHIQTVVGHYKGRVDAWDVVNEPLELLGSALYNNIFHELLGPGYIKEALEIAHAADPNAALFLNDVLISTSGPKFDAFLALLTDLVNQGAPIHGAGIQGHFWGVVEPEELHANIEALAALGLTVELTEVDVPLRENGDPVAQLESQRQEYFEVVRACVTVHACRRLTTWGFTDRYTWIDDFFGPGFDPLPLDEDYARKPAYFGVRDGLLTRPDISPIPVLPGAWVLLAVIAMAIALALFHNSRRARPGSLRAP